MAESANDVGPAQCRLHALFWRWHLFAALIVIPFVLWQSMTGTLYLWSEWWMDHRHPELRFVATGDSVALPSRQVAAALAASVPHASVQPADSNNPRQHHSSTTGSVEGIILSDVPIRSTTVLLRDSNGLPHPIFVDPYRAQVLGSLSGSDWLPGFSRALHGGWPLGDPGSWLLELGDCWAIVMVATGLYLWWPRERGLRALWPRAGSFRLLLRDLHCCVGVWFSAIFLFFLVSALPWTAFWGSTILQPIEAALGQTDPAGFSPGGASVERMREALPALDEAVRQARANGVRGTMDIRLAPWPNAPLFVTNLDVPPSQNRTLLNDARDGQSAGAFDNSDLPLIPRIVATGIHIHQGDFGSINIGLNTAFAMSLVWLSATGMVSWWVRRPRGGLGAPPRTAERIPTKIWGVIVAMGLALPIFGLSVLLVCAMDYGISGRRRSA